MKRRCLSFFMAMATALMLLPTAALAQEGLSLSSGPVAVTAAAGERDSGPPQCVCNTRCREEVRDEACAVCTAVQADLAIVCKGQPDAASGEVGPFTVSPSSAASYDDKERILTVLGDCTISNTETRQIWATISVPSGIRKITLDRVNVEGITSGLDVQAGVSLQLNLVGENRLTYGFDLDYAGVHVGPNASVYISGTGKLIATGNLGAGIGGNRDENGGTIMIGSGTLEARSVNGGAGIGGGQEGSGGVVEVYGGTVSATALYGGAGIGGGMNGAGALVSIRGGNVKAVGAQGARDIGGGRGMEKNGLLDNGPESVYRAVFTEPQDNAGLEPVLEPHPQYDISKSASIGGKWYFYLPVGPASVTYGGETYHTTVKEDHSAVFATDAARLAYNLENGSLMLKAGDGCSENAWHVIRGKTKFDHQITVASGEHYIELNDVEIAPVVGAAFHIRNGAIVHMKQYGKNRMSGGRESAGLQVDYEATLKLFGSGVLEATGGESGAGIGGGIYGTCGNVTIQSGTIIAKGGIAGSGIGGGQEGDGGDITITGGVVRAVGGASSIGSGAGNTVKGTLTNGVENIYLATLTEPATNRGLPVTVARPANYSLTGASAVDGVWYVYLPEGAAIAYYGDYPYETTVKTDHSAVLLPTVDPGIGAITINADDGCTEGKPHVISSKNTSNTVVVNAGEHYITLSGTTIEASRCAFDIRGSAVVYMTLVGSNTLKSRSNNAGLQVAEGAALVISGTGSLSATGGYGNSFGGAGIGAAGKSTCGRITIKSGIIKAQGGYNAAGIGSGMMGANNEIRIAGGTITAQGGFGGASVGCAYYGDNKNVVITGGSFGNAGIHGNPKNSSGDPVYPVNVPLPGVAAGTAVTGLTLQADGNDYDYGTTGLQTTTANQITVFLPKGVVDATYKNVVYGLVLAGNSYRCPTLMPRPKGPEVTFFAHGYDYGFLNGADSGTKYRVGNGAWMKGIDDVAGPLLVDLTPGTISVVRLGDNVNTVTSLPTIVSVERRTVVLGGFVKGCTKAENNNGCLFGLMPLTEYRKVGDTKWENCPIGGLEGLENGVYEVRNTVWKNLLAGDSKFFTIAPYRTGPTYEIALSMIGTYSYPSQYVGYEKAPYFYSDVFNIGNQSTGELKIALSGEDADSFVLGATSIADMLPDAKQGFSLVPKTGLPSGDYTATATVTGENGISRSFDVRLVVNEAPIPESSENSAPDAPGDPGYPGDVDDPDLPNSEGSGDPNYPDDPGPPPDDPDQPDNPDATGGKGSTKGGSSSLAFPQLTVQSAIDSAAAAASTATAVEQAIKAAAAKGAASATAYVSFVNCSALTRDGLGAINSAAAKGAAGKRIQLSTKLQFDTRANNVVLARITVDAAKLAAVMPESLPLNLWLQQEDAQVRAVRSRLEAHYKNKFIAITFEQQSPLAVNAELAFKADFSGINTGSLHFYSYDPIKNTITRIPAPNYWVDKNGYARITVPFGGSIIITGEPLEKK